MDGERRACCIKQLKPYIILVRPYLIGYAILVILLWLVDIFVFVCWKFGIVWLDLMME